MVSIKRAVIFGAIPAVVVVIILISVAAFYTKEVYTEIDIQAPKQHVWMITGNNTTTELGLKQHDFDNIYYMTTCRHTTITFQIYVIEQDFNFIYSKI